MEPEQLIHINKIIKQNSKLTINWNGSIWNYLCWYSTKNNINICDLKISLDVKNDLRNKFFKKKINKYIYDKKKKDF